MNGGIVDIYIVFVVIDFEKKKKGIFVFIVEKEFEGFLIGKKEKKLGICLFLIMEIMFEDCVVFVVNCFGEEGEGFKIVMKMFDGGRNGIVV